MYKNVATKLAVYAYTSTSNTPKTADAANLTAYVSKNYGAVTVLADTSATEMDATNAPGWYLFDLAQAETNADALLFTGKSSTANVYVVGQLVFTQPQYFSDVVISSAGVPQANPVGAVTLTSLTVAGEVLIQDGMNITCATADRPGLSITGNGAGDGLYTEGGATGNGTHARGGSSSGDGFFADGGVVGRGFHAKGGSSFGAGFRADALTTNANGMETIGNGTGHGLAATSGSGATGNGAYFKAASSAGNGLQCDGTTTGDGGAFNGGANGNGLHGHGNGIAAGIFAEGGTDAILGNITGNLSGSIGQPVTTTFPMKKNTAFNNFMFLMTDSTNHNPATGLTVTCQRSIDGAAFANCTTATATEVGSGYYKINLSTSDLNGNSVGLKFTATGADTTDITVFLQA